MNYESILEEFEGEIIGEPISIDIKSWKDDGDHLIGELLEIKDFEGGNFETTCKQYLFKTDEGLITTILGGSMEKIFAESDYIGKVLYIKYKGKIELEDGKRCNRFS